MKVIKKSGQKSVMDDYKIYISIEKSLRSTKLKNKQEVVASLKNEVLNTLSLSKTVITTEKIKYAVRDSLTLRGYSKQANAFMTYTK